MGSPSIFPEDLQNDCEPDSQPDPSPKVGNVTSETNLVDQNDGQTKGLSPKNFLGLSNHDTQKTTQESRLLINEDYGLSDNRNIPKSSIKSHLRPEDHTRAKIEVNFQPDSNRFLMPTAPERRSNRFVSYVNPNEEAISDIETNSSSLDNIFEGTEDARSNGQE
jgi:hypothetical protein